MPPEHTPTPWHVEPVVKHEDEQTYGYMSREIRNDEEGVYVAEVHQYGEEFASKAEANAAHIVKCVNSHEALIEALKLCVAAWQHEGEPNALGYEWAIAKAEAALAQADEK